MKLTEKIIEHTDKHKRLFLPYLWNEWGVSPKKFTEALCDIWWRFKNPRMVDNLLVLNVQDEPNYYEVCNQKYNRGKTIQKKNLWKYCKVNQKEDQHISVYSHDQKWKNNFSETGSVSCRDTIVGMDYLYLELDRPTLREAVKDGIKFYQNFEYKDYCELWYSGNNSIHIVIDASLFGKPMGEQQNITGRRRLAYNLAHKLSAGLRHEGIEDAWSMGKAELRKKHYEIFNEIIDDIHTIKQRLENIDPNLYTTNSLIRQPFSYHEKGKKQKIRLPMERFLDGNENPPKKEFDIDKNNSYINSNRTPHLLYMVYDCYKKGKKKGTYKPDVDADEIKKLYSKVFEYFDPRDADAEGWVNGLFSPFYEDTNNSVSVNIVNGYYYDFGNMDHSFTFEQFKEKYNENFNRNS